MKLYYYYLEGRLFYPFYTCIALGKVRIGWYSDFYLIGLKDLSIWMTR